MKIQDIIFAIAFISLFFYQNSRIAAFLGIACLVLSIPLFTLWIFFTAERLTWYAFAFFLLSLLLLGIKRKDE